MTYDVRTERAGPRPLAAVRATTDHQRLGADIVRLLDMVWPVLREQGVRTGHNVVVYRAHFLLWPVAAQAAAQAG